MKLSFLFFGNKPDEKWELCQQMGVKYAVAKLAPELTGDLPPWDYESLAASKRVFAENGFELIGMEGDQFDMNRIKFGLPGREADVQQYCTMLENMGRLGINLLCYNFMAGIGWFRTHEAIAARGGALVSGFDAETARQLPLTTAGVVTEAQIWENYAWFLERVLPAAEQSGVKMALHPDDPPISPLRGIGRIFINAAGIRKALSLSDSSAHGLTFCQGTYTTMGEDVKALIEEFGQSNKIFFVHIRDVAGNKENFKETFHDDGPTDMPAMLQAYQEVGFDGPLRSDHVPSMLGDDNTQHGYAINGSLFGVGYIKGMMDTLKINKYLVLLVIQLLIQVGFAKAQNLSQPWYIEPRTDARHIDLSGKWKLSYLDQQLTELKALANVKNTFETTVPNSIQWSLYKAGKLPHPYYNRNADQYKFVDEKVWYYQKNFDLPQDAKGNYSFLCFDGADYFTKVWVNGKLVGEHEGMFGGPNLEVADFLNYGGNNEIVVELRAGNWNNKARETEPGKRTGFDPWNSGKIIKPWTISGGIGGENFFSMGIWQGVRLEIVPKVHLERPYLVTRSIGAKGAKMHLSTELFVNSNSMLQTLHPWKNAQLRHPDEKGMSFIPFNEDLKVNIAFYSGGAKVLNQVIPVKTYEGRNWVEADLELSNPKLWNPTGLGDPNLYQVKVSLLRMGKVVDQTAFDYGIRVVERLPSAGPRTGDRYENWQFVVNGKKIFVKGMNFTPQDILLDVSEKRYRWTLNAAKKMGVQLIRIWGGGLIETDIFYKVCNELGIMVWQDFPIGNQDTPDYPQDVWEAQVVQNICRIRNNPSLVVWCGGNEFNAYSLGNAATIGIWERNINIFDNSRLYVRTTPDGGSIHTYPDMDPTWYKRSYGKEAWISETGMHSMPEAALFREVVDQKEFVDLGTMWDQKFGPAHPEFIYHFTEYKPSRVPRMLSRASHIDDMSNPTLESISEATQIGAGEFYQVLSEKVQGNYPVTTGLMPWVFKRHWTAIAIQMMDWFGQAGAPYYFLKRTYEPVHIALDLDRLLWAPGENIALEAQVTNSLFTIAAGYKATVSVYDDSFKQLSKKTLPLNIAKGPSVNKASFGSFTIPAEYKDKYLFLLAELTDKNGKLVSSAYYYPRALTKMEDKVFHDKYVAEPIPWETFDKGPWLKPAVAKTKTTLSLKLITNKVLSADESEIKLQLKNVGSIPAFMAKVDIAGVKRAFYASDNYVWLQPGQTLEISMNVNWREGKDRALLTASAWNATTVRVQL